MGLWFNILINSWTGNFMGHGLSKEGERQRNYMSGTLWARCFRSKTAEAVGEKSSRKQQLLRAEDNL